MEHIKDRVIKNEQLLLGNGIRHVLGPGLELDGCTLRLRGKTERSFQLAQATLRDCHIIAETPLRNLGWWCTSRIVRCRFEGDFEGNQFGRWAQDYGEFGWLEDCDFLKADVESVQLFECDLPSIALPPWPYVTLLAPHDNAPRWLERTWPGDTGLLVEGLVDIPAVTSAVLYDGRRWARDFGASEEALRETLRSVEGVRF